MELNEFFYGTPPQDTQDFSQVLRGVGRSIQDIGRGVSYYPYDLLGSGVDIANMGLGAIGLGSERPVLGSDYLRNIAQSLGLAQPSTGSGTETAARFASALINPAAGARAVGRAGSEINRLVSMIDETPPRGSVDFTPRQVSSAQQAAQEIMQPKRSDIGFYSQLEAATIPMQDKGTGDQFLAQIQKTAGVKPEEIKYTGLDDFLKGKKSVTKTEIQDYLNANKVDVQEVRLGGTMPEVGVNPDSPYAIPEVLDVFQREGNAGEGFRVSLVNDYDAYMALERQFPDLLEQDEWADVVANSLFPNRQQVTPTKFSSKTLPGGENYRELLLTLPAKKLTEDEARIVLGAAPDAKLSSADIAYASRKNVDEYRSTHFDQPNILAHMRVNDRTVDGKKTLFIEEIQSDWHQAGRKKGYKGAFTDLPEGYQVVEKQRQDATYYEVYSPEGTQVGGGYNREGAVNGVINELNDTIGGVPDAPFKTTWHELTLKRAIQEASEKGYDQIAFTTGKTQAERYDLSKQVEAIRVNLNPDKTYQIGIQPPGRNMQFFNSSVPPNKLSEIVGKDLAEKISKEVTQTGVDSGKVFSGLDLQVGGEGMKGFYDNILPKSLDKLGKKFDAKVGKTEMDGVEVWQMDITPKMRESVTTKGQPLFAVPAVGLLGAGMYQDEQVY